MSHVTEIPPGTSVYTGSPQSLLLDLDTEAAVKHFVFMLGVVHRHVRSVRVWKSKSKGTHAEVVWAQEFESDIERFFLQLLLGSDPFRELHNWERGPSWLGDVLFKPFKPKEEL